MHTNCVGPEFSIVDIASAWVVGRLLRLGRRKIHYKKSEDRGAPREAMLFEMYWEVKCKLDDVVASAALERNLL